MLQKYLYSKTKSYPEIETMIDVPVLLTSLWHPNIHPNQAGHIFANVPGPKPVQLLVAVQSPESPSEESTMQRRSVLL